MGAIKTQSHNWLQELRILQNLVLNDFSYRAYRAKLEKETSLKREAEFQEKLKVNRKFKKKNFF